MQESIETLVSRAQAHRNAGENIAAINLWREIVKRAPDNLVYQHNFAAALGDAGFSGEAAKVAGAAIDAGLDRPETHLVYARALSGIQKNEEAESAYRQVIAKTPGDAIVHRELSQLIWMRTGDATKAEEGLRNAIAAHPDDLALQIMLGEVRGQMGDPQGQFALMKGLADRTGQNPQVCHFAARAAMSAGAYSVALDYGRIASTAAPDEDEPAAVFVTALLANGDAKEASRRIDVLRARRPENQYFIALQATAWRLLGDDRYQVLYDYDGMVFSAPLDTPRGWSGLKAYLDELSGALNDAHSSREHPFFLSVRHGSQIPSITKFENPAMRAFSEAVRGPLEGYLAHIGEGKDPLRTRNLGGYALVDAWSVSLPPAGYHVNHVHPAGWLSSACHLEPPADDPENPHAGWLKFGEPGCATTPVLGAERLVKPTAGTMVIFPSYMWHGTERFSKGAARLTVAADFLPTR